MIRWNEEFIAAEEPPIDAYDKGYGGAPVKILTPRRLRTATIGVTALFVGIVALALAALAALPMLVWERPQPTIQESSDAIADEAEGRFSLKWKDFKISFGRTNQAEDESARAEREAQQRANEAARTADMQALQLHESRLRWFTFASAGFALLGLTLGPIAWARERHPALARCAMAISGVALLWQSSSSELWSASPC